MAHVQATFSSGRDEPTSKTSERRRSQVGGERKIPRQNSFNNVIHTNSKTSSKTLERQRQSSEQQTASWSESDDELDLDEGRTHRYSYDYGFYLIKQAFEPLKMLILCYIIWLLLSHVIAATYRTASEMPTPEFATSPIDQGQSLSLESHVRPPRNPAQKAGVSKFFTCQQQIGMLAAPAKKAQALSERMSNVMDAVTEIGLWADDQNFESKAELIHELSALRSAVERNTNWLVKLATQVKGVIDHTIVHNKFAAESISTTKRRKINLPPLVDILRSFSRPFSMYDPNPIIGKEVKGVFVQLSSSMAKDLRTLVQVVEPCYTTLQDVFEIIDKVKSLADEGHRSSTKVIIFASLWEPIAFRSRHNRDTSYQISMKNLINHYNSVSGMIDTVDRALDTANGDLRSFQKWDAVHDAAWYDLHLTDTVAVFHDIANQLQQGHS